MKWGRQQKKSTTVNLQKNPDESGGMKKNVEARLPTAPLGVEIPIAHAHTCLRGKVFMSCVCDTSANMESGMGSR